MKLRSILFVMPEEIPFKVERPWPQFPFITYTFEVGPYLVNQRSMILFKNYGVQKKDELSFNFNQHIGIREDEVVMDFFEDTWGQGSGGHHLTLKLPTGIYSAICEEKRRPNKVDQLQYSCLRNDELIGEFTIENENYGFIEGKILGNQFDKAWFLGLSLVKLLEIRDSETAGGD